MARHCCVYVWNNVYKCVWYVWGCVVLMSLCSANVTHYINNILMCCAQVLLYIVCFCKCVSWCVVMLLLCLECDYSDACLTHYINSELCSDCCVWIVFMWCAMVCMMLFDIIMLWHCVEMYASMRCVHILCVWIYTITN